MTCAAALADVTVTAESFADLLLALHDARYTGAVLLHVIEGVPKVVEFPARQVRLVTGPSASLDNPARLVHTP